MSLNKNELNNAVAYYDALVYQMMRDNKFMALGIHLSSIRIKFEDNESFLLKDYTFGYFNPINQTIHINYEDDFFQKSKNEEEKKNKLFFILFHEANHNILMHTNRLGSREKDIWNIAADYEIHNMLYMYSSLMDKRNFNLLNNPIDYCINMLIKWDDVDYKPNKENGEIKGMFSKQLENNIAEEIYQMIDKTKTENVKEFSINENGNEDNNNNNGCGNCTIKVKIATYTLPDGSKHQSVSIDFPDYDKLPEEEKKKNENNKSLQRQLMEKNLIESVKSKGNEGGKINDFLKHLFKIKIDWKKILRSSLRTILDKGDSFTWTKPRKSMMSLGYFLPDVDTDVEKYGTLIVARDESGSMSNDDIRKAAAIIVEAKEFYKKIIILKHDTEIQYEGSFEDLNDDVINMLCTRSAEGGTSHKPVFDYINNYSKKHNAEEEISCVINITDCCSDIQQYQDTINNKIPLVYLVPENSMEYTKGIKGKIIEIN